MSEKSLLLSWHEKVASSSSWIFLSPGGFLVLTIAVRMEPGSFCWDSENNVGTGLRLEIKRGRVVFLFKYFSSKCFTHTNASFKDLSLMSFRLKNFIYWFRKFSSFGSTNTVPCWCPVQLLKHTLHVHLLTLFNIQYHFSRDHIFIHQCNNGIKCIFNSESYSKFDRTYHCYQLCS